MREYLALKALEETTEEGLRRLIRCEERDMMRLKELLDLGLDVGKEHSKCQEELRRLSAKLESL